MVNADRDQTTRRVAAIEGLCLLAVGGNLLLPGIFGEVNPRTWFSQLVFMACGALVAEVCLLGIWCGLSRQPIKYRLPVTVALVLVAACSYSLGLQLPDLGSLPARGIPLEAALMIAGAGFGMFAVMQIPLWLIRRSFHCRIARRETVQFEDSLKARQFSVGYLMLWMALVGVLLVLVRNSLPEHSSPPPIFALFQIVTAMLVYIGLSSLLCIPCVWIALTERPLASASSLLAGTLIAGPFLVFVCTNMIFGGTNTEEVLIGVACFEAGLAGTTLAVLLALRLLGYRVHVVGK